MTTKMQLLVLAFAVFVAVSCLPCVAQGTTPQAPPSASSAGQSASDQEMTADPETRAKVQARLQQLSSELNLSDDQKAKLKPILQSEVAELKTVQSDTSLSPDQRRAKTKAVHDTYKSQISAILTPEQQQKLQSMKEELKDQ
jgi:protein CpxP